MIAASLLTGCSVTKYGKFFNASLGTDRNLQHATVTVNPTNGIQTLTIDGYMSKQAETAGAISQGVASGIASALLGKAPQAPVVTTNPPPK